MGFLTLKKASFFLAFTILVGLKPYLGLAAPSIPRELEGVGITEKLGASIFEEETEFTDETGKTRKLSEYFGKGRPVVLDLVYYECPMLCNFHLQGVLDALRKVPQTVGKDFDVVLVSIDPTEGPELAAKKKANILERYGREGAEKGWHLLTGKKDQIKKLAKMVGFGYRYDKKQKEYAHSAVANVMTAGGILSRYLYGVQFEPRDVRLALLEASSGRIGTIMDRVLLFCYRYDPASRSYSLVASRLVQAGSLVMVLIVGTWMTVFWRRQRKG